jgi:hypothetical protein
MSKTLILEKFEQHKGEFIIINNKVSRLIAVGDDGEDYYWVTYDGRSTIWSSCVGRFIVLKNKIDDSDYDEFIRIAKINHLDQDDLWLPKTPEDKLEKKEMAKKHKEFIKLQSTEGNDVLLTEICWDLN